MEIRESREGDVLVLAPDGNVAGGEETSAMEAKLEKALKTGFRRLVLDCAGVGQLTSAAIRILLMTSRKLDRTEGRLVLCGMNTKVQKAFSISGFDKDFTVVATREEAVQRVLEPPRPRPVKVARAKAAVIAEVPVPVPDAVVEKPAATVVTPPGLDLRALASALIDTLGAHVPVAANTSRAARWDLDAVASGILAALRGGVS